jgi:hypothetical protein
MESHSKLTITLNRIIDPAVFSLIFLKDKHAPLSYPAAVFVCTRGVQSFPVL